MPDTQPMYIPDTRLVGGFNPVEKYAHQVGSFPQVGMNMKKYLKPPPRHPPAHDTLSYSFDQIYRTQPATNATKKASEFPLPRHTDIQGSPMTLVFALFFLTPALPHFAGKMDNFWLS